MRFYLKSLKEAHEDNIDYYSDADPDYFKFQLMYEHNTKIPLNKVDGKWKISKITKNMVRDMDGGSSEFIDDFKKNPYYFLR